MIKKYVSKITGNFKGLYVTKGSIYPIESDLVDLNLFDPIEISTEVQPEVSEFFDKQKKKNPKKGVR